jgi:PadR family transcriptional regulator PadR
MRADTVRGHLDLLLLGELSKRAGHGYAVITALNEAGDGQFDLAEGTVYPALHRLEDRGLLASEWQPVAGRRRRIYRLTAAGRSALTAERSEWRALVAAVDRVLHAAPVAARG